MNYVPFSKSYFTVACVRNSLYSVWTVIQTGFVNWINQFFVKIKQTNNEINMICS